MTTAFDRRRIPAPEDSYPPELSHSGIEAGPSNHAARSKSTKPIYLKAGLISQANGSGYIESGRVKIACSVYGPRPKQPPYSPQGTLNLEVKFAPFASHSRRAPLRDTEPAALSSLIHSHLLPALQLHLLPKSALDIQILVIESDSVPNVLSAALTVASMAVADAGIPMNGLGVGVMIDSEGSGDRNQSDIEVHDSGGTISMGVMPALGRISGIWMTGEMSLDQACSLIDTGVQASKSTHAILAQSLIARAAEQLSSSS
ncbi:3' exoribonuclease family, domain 1-domain-containing protein [Kockovaella imperatae]|uniref:3' exoribonuclease family, domain 1-domain-containing protein n=1 Tax=Kockovaella imperatae TaxID=4999 RepID=A0A1Y1U7R6_9TREE|nr:3' exoribonuclease family, domain 1-domain-containing protein [Kockovaella imperatae]ORX34079.1 3' exoribonuclease family, domain 1-domain-containing protein [Kockovaella imperatae]